MECLFPFTAINTNYFCVIEVSCWILTGERQTAVIRSRYVQVLLNQDMSFFDTYGNNGDIVSQVLSDVLLIQSALSEKVRSTFEILSPYKQGQRDMYSRWGNCPPPLPLKF